MYVAIYQSLIRLTIHVGTMRERQKSLASREVPFSTWVLSFSFMLPLISIQLVLALRGGCEIA